MKYKPPYYILPILPNEKRRNINESPVICKDEPLNAGVLAMDVLDNFFSQEQKDLIILNGNKNQILPKKLQEKVSITALSRGMLILSSKSSVWKAEALAIKTDIVAACNRVLGKIAVKSLRFG